MSASTPVIQSSAGTALSRAADYVAAEWLKLRSGRSTYVVVFIALAATIGIAIAATSGDVRGWDGWSPAEKTAFDALNQPFAGFPLAQLALAVLGVLTISGEYSSGAIRTTLLAVPGKRSMLASKAAALAVSTLILAAAIATGSFALGQAILHGKHIGLGFGDPGTVRALVAATCYLVAVALTGFGLGALLRNTAAAISVVVALFFLAPGLIRKGKGFLGRVHNALPEPAFQRLVSGHPGSHAPTIPLSWVVLAAYPIVLLVLAAVLIRRRDA